MGMSMNSGGGRRSGGRRARRAMSEINVTPMVDVMLVLLIIFMVAAPLLTTGVNVDLPSARAPQLQEPDNQALTISVDAEGRIFLQETEVESQTLIPRLVAITEANPEARIYIRGDSALQYGVVMEVLGQLYSAGFTKAALVTRPTVGAQQQPPANQNR